MEVPLSEFMDSGRMFQSHNRVWFLQLNGADDRRDSTGPLLGHGFLDPVVAQRQALVFLIGRRL